MKIYKDALGFAKVEDKNGLKYLISTTLHDEIKETEQQIKALKEKAEEIVETYILTTPTDKESGATMVVSKLAQPIIEMNELLNKH